MIGHRLWRGLGEETEIVAARRHLLAGEPIRLGRRDGPEVDLLPPNLIAVTLPRGDIQSSRAIPSTR